MKDVRINNLKNYFEFLNLHKALLFRGVSNVEKHKLIPSIARGWIGGIGELVSIERTMIENLKLRSAILLDKPPAYNNTLEWLVLGQHHGMPTRLLDWTTNPLVALYFACANDFDEEGAVYLLDGLPRLDINTTIDPFNMKTDCYLAPRHITTRIPSQSACFTVQRHPTKELKVQHYFYNGEENDDRIIVSSSFVKRQILEELQTVGISPAVLFPGLDGLCKQIANEGLYLRDKVISRRHFDKELREMVKKSSILEKGKD